MKKYLDKDFYRFLGVFISIITISLVAILASRIWQEQSHVQAAGIDSNTQN